MPRALTHIPVLTVQECSVIREVVHGLKSQWVRRAATPFFSLGTASYLDAQTGETSLLPDGAVHKPSSTAPRGLAI